MHKSSFISLLLILTLGLPAGGEVIVYEAAPTPQYNFDSQDSYRTALARPRRDELVGERIVIGGTWYEYQSNGCLGKTIVLDADGGSHIVWTNGFNADWANCERHTFYNYVVDAEAQFEAGVAVDNLARGGFCNITHHNRLGAIPVQHATQDGVVWTFFAIDDELGAGEFTLFRPPRIGGDEMIWPRGAVDRQGRVHTLARTRNEAGLPVALQYVGAALNDDDEWQYTQPRNVRNMKGLAYVCAASRVSNRISLVFPSPIYPEGENARWSGVTAEGAANNNILVFESANGVDFPWDNPINATQVLRPNPNANQNSPFYQGDTLRPVMFVDACYDNDDNLHIVFSSVVLWEQIDPNASPGWVAGRYDEKRNMIWHWDRESNLITLVASGRWTTDGNVGNWKQNLSYPSIAVDEDGNLYCVFTLFPERGDRSAAGFVCGEIYAAKSVDNGMTWAAPINLTDTHSNNAGAGECNSECWSSLAEVVDEFLHITYVYDRDAGGVPQDEGVATNNQVMYHRVEREEIPSEPRLLGRDFHIGLPPQIQMPMAEIMAVAVPGDEAGVADWTIRNTAEEGIGLHFRLTASEAIRDMVAFEPSALRLAPGGEARVAVRFTPEEQGEFEGTILVEHNAPNIRSPIELPFLGLGAAGYGELTGRVTDLATGNPVANAQINLNPGRYAAVSDDEGYYIFENLPAYQYTLTTTFADYLPFTNEVEIAVDERAVLNIPLRFATFELSHGRIEISVSVDDEFDARYSAFNRGNGPINYRSALIFPGGGNLDPWTLRESIPVGQIVSNTRICSAIFLDDFFYIAGGNSGGQNINYIYVFDREGREVRRFQQPVNSLWGFRDLAWDGRLLWGGDTRTLYGIDLQGQLIARFDTPINPVRGVAWDPDRQAFWVCDLRTPVVAVTREGREIARLRQPDTTRIYGLAYLPSDPDSFPLYIFNSNENTGHPLEIMKCNPVNNQIRSVRDLVGPNDARSGGIEFSTDYDPYSVVALAGWQANPDAIAVYQVAARTDWVSLEPLAGTIDAQGRQEFTLHLNTTGLPVEAAFDVTVRTEHNGRRGFIELPVHLVVTEEGGVTQRRLEFGFGWNLVSLNIEPDSANIAGLTRPLVENGALLMVKDSRGRFYNPARNFINIPRWNSSEGYLFKLARPAELDVIGIGIGYDRPIALAEGWQMAAYYPRTPVAAPEALEGLDDNLIIAKNGAGDFYLPEFDFCNMAPLREGQGYQIKVRRGCELVYRLGGGMVNYIAGEKPQHFTLPTAGDENMSVLLLNVPAEIIEIAVGAGSVDIAGAGARDDAGRIGLAVWNSGFDEGEPLVFSGWDGQDERGLSVEWRHGAGFYQTDAIAVGDVLWNCSLPNDYALHPPYPNPFNAAAQIRFDLPARASVRIGLFDISSREIVRIAAGVYLAGAHCLTLNGSLLPSGIYYLRLDAAGRSLLVKAVVIK
ncbi:MAG: hypothetical protein FJY65_01900 [Calditrichaeota bacterium]|nr:hypothetical protein [Calditrichota bacterium]